MHTAPAERLVCRVICIHQLTGRNISPKTPSHQIILETDVVLDAKELRARELLTPWLLSDSPARDKITVHLDSHARALCRKKVRLECTCYIDRAQPLLSRRRWLILRTCAYAHQYCEHGMVAGSECLNYVLPNPIPALIRSTMSSGHHFHDAVVTLLLCWY